MNKLFQSRKGAIMNPTVLILSLLVFVVVTILFFFIIAFLKSDLIKYTGNDKFIPNQDISFNDYEVSSTNPIAREGLGENSRYQVTYRDYQFNQLKKGIPFEGSPLSYPFSTYDFYYRYDGFFGDEENSLPSSIYSNHLERIDDQYCGAYKDLPNGCKAAAGGKK